MSNTELEKLMLLTEAEACAIYIAATSPEDFNARLRERGLIAPEPVDPLLVEAREIEARHCELAGFNARARQIRAGEYDEDGPVRCTLRGLRRGMELGRSDPVRPPLTVEVVREAMNKVWSDADEQMTVTGFADRLHAALTASEAPDAGPRARLTEGG